MSLHKRETTHVRWVCARGELSRNEIIFSPEERHFLCMKKQKQDDQEKARNKIQVACAHLSKLIYTHQESSFHLNMKLHVSKTDSTWWALAVQRWANRKPGNKLCHTSSPNPAEGGLLAASQRRPPIRVVIIFRTLNSNH